MVTMLVAGSMCASPPDIDSHAGRLGTLLAGYATYLRLPGVPSSGDWRSSVAKLTGRNVIGFGAGFAGSAADTFVLVEDHRKPRLISADITGLCFLLIQQNSSDGSEGRAG